MDHNAGVSINTTLKQQHLDLFLQVHMKVVDAITRKGKAPPVYRYFDLNGGPGLYWGKEVLEGSPLLALKWAQTLGLPLEAHLTEHDPKTFQQLCRAIRGRGLTCLEADGEGWLYGDAETAPRVKVWCYPTSHLVQMARLLKRLRPHKHQNGLVYSDENGARVPYALLAAFAEHYPKVDILIHVSGTGVKRALPYQGVNDQIMSLEEGKAMIRKDHWQIRELYGPQQWTFLFGTNWGNAFELKKQGFHKLESPTGRSIYQRLTRTWRDDEGAQPSLFGT
jgi:hypothetical protein